MEAKKEINEKNDKLRNFTQSQIDIATKKKIRTILTLLLQELGKDIKRVQIEADAFSNTEDIYDDVISCARIVRQSADELEAIVKTHVCEVIDIARK